MLTHVRLCPEIMGPLGKPPASLALLKYSRRQNTCVDKYSRRQNVLAPTNVGACAEASPYCFGQTESTAADFSQTSLMFPYFSQKVLIFPHAFTKWAVALAALFSWAQTLSRTVPAYCTGPPCRKMSQILAWTKY